MNLCRASAAAAVLLLASACGKSAEEMRFDALRATCQALAAGTATLAEANPQFGFSGAFLCSAQQLTRMKAGDQCPYDSQFICKGYWASVSSDPSLCNLPIGGCWYWCEARFPGTPSSTTITASTVVCGARFISGQPYLPGDFPH
jgi:hypothetical protein